MLHKIKLLPLVLLLALFVNSCEEDPTGSSVPNSITGKLVLTNIDTKQPLSDHSGVIVSIEGTTIKATTSTDGKYTLTNIPPGVFVITMAKPGFDSLVLRDIEYSGVGVEFLSDRIMYSLTEGELVLDPVLLMNVMDLAASIYGDPRLIRDSIHLDSLTGVPDTTLVIGGNDVRPDTRYYVFTGTAKQFNHIQIILRLTDSTGMAREFTQPPASYSDGDRFVWAIDAAYIGEWLDERFNGNPVTAHLRVELIGQEVLSNAQPVPRN